MDTAAQERKQIVRTIAIFTIALVLFATLFLVLIPGCLFWSMRRDELTGHVPHVRSLGLAFATYANDKNCFPPLSSKPGRLMFDPDALYPHYQESLISLLSDADPISDKVYDKKPTPDFCVEHSSYFYLGYRVWNDETVALFADAYRKRIAQYGRFDTDLPVDSPMEKIVRIDYVSRSGPISDEEAARPKWEFSRHSPAEIPVLIERPHPYPGPFGLWLGFPVPLSKSQMGGFVLYQDGHYEFIRYPGKWPMTQTTIGALNALAPET